MHKNIHSIDVYHISKEEYRELCKQPAANMVVEAVKQYNEMVSLSGHFEDGDVNALLIKEAEEEEVKVFLDGIFDVVEKRNS